MCTVCQVVIVLVGLIGSGKSTFALAVEELFPNIVRCNQDDLGDRRAVEEKVHKALSEGRSVCVDRTNIDAGQRWHWLNIGRGYPGVEVWGVLLDVPKAVCLKRLETRTGHPTIKDYEKAKYVLREFTSQFVPPSTCEGFDLVFHMPHEALEASRTGPPIPDPASQIVSENSGSVGAIYTEDDIRDVLGNFAQAAQHPYRPKRGPLPPNPARNRPGAYQGRGPPKVPASSRF